MFGYIEIFLKWFWGSWSCQQNTSDYLSMRLKISFKTFYTKYQFKILFPVFTIRTNFANKPHPGQISFLSFMTHYRLVKISSRAYLPSSREMPSLTPSIMPRSETNQLSHLSYVTLHFVGLLVAHGIVEAAQADSAWRDVKEMIVNNNIEENSCCNRLRYKKYYVIMELQLTSSERVKVAWHNMYTKDNCNFHILQVFYSGLI